MFKPKKRLTTARLRTNTTLRKLRKEFAEFLSGSAKIAKVGRKRTRRYTQAGLKARRGRVQVPVKAGQRVSVTKSGEIRVSEAVGSARIRAIQDRAEAVLRRRFNPIERNIKGLTTNINQAVRDLRALVARKPDVAAGVMDTADTKLAIVRSDMVAREVSYKGEWSWSDYDYEDYDHEYDDYPELGYYHGD